MNQEQELHELFEQLITDSSLSDVAKQAWQERLKNEGGSAALLSSLKTDIQQQLQAEEKSLDDELNRITAEVAKVEQDFKHDFSGVLSEERKKAQQTQKDHDQRMLEEIRNSLNT